MARKSIASLVAALFIALPVAIPGAAFAQVGINPNPPRADASRMTCGEARHLVARSGGAVIYEGPGRYDLYHPNGGACASLMQVGQRAYIRTRDTSQCFIGYTCVEPEPLFDRWR